MLLHLFWLSGYDLPSKSVRIQFSCTSEVLLCLEFCDLVAYVCFCKKKKKKNPKIHRDPFPKERILTRHTVGNWSGNKTVDKSRKCKIRL